MNTGNMDFKDLTVFLAVFDCKSVSGAAVELGMSQPGLSTALRRLRERFGDQLFVRTSTAMEPTARARELVDPIRSILHLLDHQVLAAQQFDPATSTDEFRIAMSDIGEYGFLPLIMAALGREAPHMRITSVSPRYDKIERAMELGEIDFALGYFPDLTSANIVETVISHGAFGCFVGPHNPMANRHLTMEQFCAAGHILVEPAGRSQEVFETYFRSKGIKRNIVLRTSSFLCIPQILTQTNLIAPMPAALGGLKDWGVEPVSLPFELPVAELKTYWHRLAHSDANHRWIRQLIAREVKVFETSLAART